MASPVTETFDGVVLSADGDGDDSRSLGGSPRVFSDWTMRILDENGLDVSSTGPTPSYLDVTGNVLDSDLVGPGDNALSVNGWFGVAAQAQFSATTGEEFWLQSFHLENVNMGANVRVLGYRDGVLVASQDLTIAVGADTLVTLDHGADQDWQNIDEFRIVQQDGSADILFYIDDITVAAVDQSPTVVASSGITAFVEADSVTSTPVVVDSGLTLSDNDSATLASATVSITGNLQSGQDILAFVNDGSTMGNIAGSYNAATGVLTLASAGATATLAEWQVALRSVTFTNSSDTPATGGRTVSFVVNDGSSDSSAATKTVSVTDINDAPVVSVPGVITVTEDVASAVTGISFSDADSGSGSVTATFSVGSGTLAATSGGGVTAGGTSTALTLTGTIANINAFISASNVTFTTAANVISDVTLTAGISDGGNTGTGGAQTDSDTMTLQVAAVNDAPVVTTPMSISVNEDVVTALAGISFADVDAGSGTVTADFIVSSGTLTGTSGSGVSVTGSGTGSLSLSGSIADINLFIMASELRFQTALNSTSNVVLTVGIDDNGNTGSGGNLNDTDTVTLMVTAVNDAPVNSAPAAQAVDQDSVLVFNNANGNLISISDVDAGGGTVRVTLTTSNGLLTLPGTTGLSFIVGSGANDGAMTFEGTISDINAALNGTIFSPTAGYNGAASLQITTSDLGLTGSGGTQTDTDTIAITVNGLEPEVDSVNVSNPDGGYKVGDFITVTVTFDQAVTVNTIGGSPTLLLETGVTDRLATYVSGSGSNTLTFSYTVQAGDLSADLDYQSTGALALNGATIRSAASDDAILTLPATGGADSIAGQHDLVVDGVAPTVGSVSVPANGTYTAGQNLDFTVNFLESVIVDTASGAPRLAVTLDTGGAVYANYVSGSGTSALLFRLTVTDGQQDLTGITIGSIDLSGSTLRDAVGNDAVPTLNGVGSTAGVLVDTAPADITGTLQIDEAAANGSLVGALTAVGASSYTFSLVSGTGDDDNAIFSIDSSGDVSVLNGLLLDYEQKTTFSIRVRAEDLGGVGFEKVLTGIVNDVGPETVVGDGDANTIFGGALDDNLSGGGGNDWLDGGGGADTMDGGAGDDFYFVDNAGDIVIATVGDGSDRVLTSLSYTLAPDAEVELLTTGNPTLTTPIDLTGNRFAQTLIGNNGANRLDGKGGADVMNGWGGDDFHFVDNVGDVVIAAVGAGNDRVFTSVHYGLAVSAEIEMLTTVNVLHTTNLQLTGNYYDQTIIGNAGHNTLNGKGGNDILNGRGGNDFFVFDTALRADNVDTIIGYATADDTIRLDDAIFTQIAAGAGGFLASTQFTANATGLATNASHRIAYETDTGNLFYDADGAGGAARIQFASLSSGLAMTHSEFFVI